MEVGQKAHVQVLPVVLGIVDLDAQRPANRDQLDANLYWQNGEARAGKVDQHSGRNSERDTVRKVDVDLTTDAALVVGRAHPRVREEGKGLAQVDRGHLNGILVT